MLNSSLGTAVCVCVDWLGGGWWMVDGGWWIVVCVSGVDWLRRPFKLRTGVHTSPPRSCPGRIAGIHPRRHESGGHVVGLAIDGCRGPLLACFDLRGAVYGKKTLL